MENNLFGNSLMTSKAFLLLAHWVDDTNKETVAYILNPKVYILINTENVVKKNTTKVCNIFQFPISCIVKSLVRRLKWKISDSFMQIYLTEHHIQYIKCFCLK